MSISAVAIADGAIGTLPSRKVKMNQPPTRRTYVVRSDVPVVPEAR